MKPNIAFASSNRFLKLGTAFVACLVAVGCFPIVPTEADLSYQPLNLTNDVISPSAIAEEFLVSDLKAHPSGSAYNYQLSIEKQNRSGTVSTYGAKFNIVNSYLPPGSRNPSNSWDIPRMLLRNAGKLWLITGTCMDGVGETIGIARLNESDGRLDNTFYGTGRVFDDVETSASSCVLGRRLAKIVNNKLYVVAQLNSGNWLVRYTLNGERDFEFGTNGTVLLPSFSYINGLDVDASGNIFVSGNGTRRSGPIYDIAVAKVTSTGAVDSTFGTLGLAQATGSAVYGAIAYSQNDNYKQLLALLDDGTPVVLGSAPSGQLGLVHFRADGSLDPNFGTSGATTIEKDTNAYTVEPGAILVLRNRENNIFVTGHSMEALSGNSNGNPKLQIRTINSAGVARAGETNTLHWNMPIPPGYSPGRHSPYNLWFSGGKFYSAAFKQGAFQGVVVRFNSKELK